jgi:hypothetical protein
MPTLQSACLAYVLVGDAHPTRAEGSAYGLRMRPIVGWAPPTNWHGAHRRVGTAHQMAWGSSQGGHRPPNGKKFQIQTPLVGNAHPTHDHIFMGRPLDLVQILHEFAAKKRVQLKEAMVAMKAAGQKGLFLHSCVLFCILFSACSHPPERHHPMYADLTPSIRKVLFLSPEVNVFDTMADGTLMRHEAGSHAARDYIQQAVINRLIEKHFIVEAPDAQFMATAETQSVQRLFRAVNRSIQLHTYGPQIFPLKVKSFDYQLGPLTSLLKLTGADAVVLTIGHQIISEHRPGAWISIALVDSQGRIVWYGMQKGDATESSLQIQEKAKDLVDTTLHRFPRGSS